MIHKVIATKRDGIYLFLKCFCTFITHLVDLLVSHIYNPDQGTNHLKIKEGSR